MTVAYLLLSNRPALAASQEVHLCALSREGDEVVVSMVPGVKAAIFDCLSASSAEIVRIVADDDDYLLPDSMKAVEAMEAHPEVAVMMTGGVKTNVSKAVCVPRGARYGESLASVVHYGACGSGQFLRRDAIEKHGLLDYDGRLLDNFTVFKAIESGATVRFCRLDTYRHHMSLKDMPREDYAAFQKEKRTLRSRFGVWGLKPRAHESPPVWDGEFA